MCGPSNLCVLWLVALGEIATHHGVDSVEVPSP